MPFVANDEMMRAFSADPSNKLPGRPKAAKKEPVAKARKPMKRGKPLERGKGPQEKTIAQKLKEAKWAGIKEAFLYLMTRYDPEGPHCEECGIPGNAKTLDLDHLRPKGTGGEWDARNAGLKCNRFSKNGPNACHPVKHGVPQWSSQEAS